MLSIGNDKAVILKGDRALYKQLSGVELVVFGRRRVGPFPWPVQDVDSFVVRASAGVPAVDGTLRRAVGRDVLELRDGRRVTVARLPERLARANGMRVWIAGPLDAPVASNVIDPTQKLDCAE